MGLTSRRQLVDGGVVVVVAGARRCASFALQVGQGQARLHCKLGLRQREGEGAGLRVKV